MSRRLARTSLLAALLTALLPGSASAADVSDPTGTTTSGSQAADDAARNAAILKKYGGDPAREGDIVADEDRRVLTVRTVASLAVWNEDQLKAPYRLSTGSTYTLVLTQRRDPYTVKDLLRLAPQTFLRQDDGSYLLLENIIVDSGAWLSLSNPGGLSLRLSSSPRAFTSIVSLGGRLEFLGSKQQPVRITSWDERAGKIDSFTGDGRAYIRAQGGQFSMRYTNVSSLGFWSGRTGGVSLTGTDRPNTGQLETLNDTIKGKTARKRARDNESKTPEVTDPSLPEIAGSKSGDISPSGDLPTPTLDVAAPSLSYVSASIARSSFSGNAYGLFIASARGVEIADTIVENSLVDGITLHRFVTSTVIERTTSRRNRGDGFVINRAATGLLVNESTAEKNYGNGFTVSGRSLADGPSPMGSPTVSYGNNNITNSIARSNARYGIEVIGGIQVAVQGNVVKGNDMGIVVRLGATDVRVTGNEVSEQKRQGISVRDGVTASSVTGNVVTGAVTGVYVRDSSVSVIRNTIDRVRLHAVTVLGKSTGTKITSNFMSGRGPSAIDSKRAHGTSLIGNRRVDWVDTSPLAVKLKRWIRPSTALWIFVAILIAITLIRGRKTVVQRGNHPYAKQLSLQHDNVIQLPDHRVLVSRSSGSESHAQR